MGVFEFITGVLLLLVALTVPGYSLSLAFFPSKKELDALERLTFSFAFSIAFVPLVILIEMQLFGYLLTSGLAWANFIGVSLLGLAVWAVRAKRINAPTSLNAVFRPVKHKSDGVPLFFERWF
ncbi:MAG: DUF1616 domain-containing protein [Candidatus Diapherotrites archaeon]|nr:DUF1616 domain-containing protein [Candidatus Diapherotrites archaeon]